MPTDIERRINHLEQTILAQGSLLTANATSLARQEERSAERLEYLRERFDIIDARLERSSNFSRYWITTMLSVVFAVAVSVNYMYIEPIIDDVKALERRLMVHEADHHGVVDDADTE